MAEPGIYRDASSRLLRHKLQSLNRRLDELEEATKNIQKAEEELLDLQDKIIQAEGSNSAMLAEADALRKRVLKIEGKDEEIKKAEDICRTVKEALENEEQFTKDLKHEIEMLQTRMAELEKLEEAFNKSKTDCTQLCLSLNEEKNLTKKLTSELETLRIRIKELEESESRLDKTEKSILTEMENLKTLTTAFVNERSHLVEKQKQDNIIIQELMQKVEQNNRLSTADQSRNATNLMERSLSLSERGALRIEDDISSKVSKESRTKGNSEDLKQTKNEEAETKEENRKSNIQEDNKVKDLNQEIEKLKDRIKQLQAIEEDLKKAEAKNGDLLEDLKRADVKNKELLETLKKTKNKNDELEIKFLAEQKKTISLNDQIEGLKQQLGNRKLLQNGEVDTEENSFFKAQRQEKTRFSVASKPKPHESSPLKKRERVRSKDPITSESSTAPSSSKNQISNPGSLKLSKAASGLAENWKKPEEKTVPSDYSATKAIISQSDVRKPREQQSALSRYLSAVSVKNTPMPWKASGAKHTFEKPFTITRDGNQSNTEALSEKQKQDTVSASELSRSESNGHEGDSSSNDSISSLSSGLYRTYGSHTSSPVPVNGNGTASYTESISFSSRSLDSKEKFSEMEGLMPKTSGMLPDISARAASVSSRYPSSRFREIPSESSSVKSVNEEDTTAFVSSSSTTAVTQNKEDTKRPCSPRTSLRTKAIINPVITDRDQKEVMGGPTAEMTTELNRQSKNVYSKVTSSITIYPSEPASPRSIAGDPPRERHTSTTSIILPQNESPLPRNSISLPISINQSDIVLRPPTVDEDSACDNINRTEASLRLSNITVSPKVVAESNDNESDSEGPNWRSHRRKEQLKEDAVQTKNVTVRNVSKSPRSYWQENKSKSEDLFSTNSSMNRKSVVDNNGMNVKTNSSEPSSRRHSPSIDWEVTEELLRKSKKILNRSVADSSRGYDQRNVSGPIPWSQRLSPTRDGSPDSMYSSSISPRERVSSFSSEKVTKPNTGNKRHSVKPEFLQDRSGSPPRPVGTKREERGRSRRSLYLDH